MPDDKLTRRDFLGKCVQGGASFGLICAGLGPAFNLVPAAWRRVGDVSDHPALFAVHSEGKDIQCILCPRMCKVKPGERGLCASRENVNGEYRVKVYGKPAQILIDPIEKDPFFHYRPGSKTLALGTPTCNLTCHYCQSWSFAQARPEETDNQDLPPDKLVAQAKKYGLKSITFTFSEPVQCIEYVIDTAALAREHGIDVTVHTAAYVNVEPIKKMCENLTAVNVDLKGFTEEFYRDICGGQLAPVLKAIKAIKETGVWLELTNLVVPDCNDSPDMVRNMSRWIVKNLGRDVPLHFGKFFPMFKMANKNGTPLETLKNLRRIAWFEGVRYPYIGNVPGEAAESTYCPKCRAKVIHRAGYNHITNVGLNLKTGKCRFCGYKIPGIWS